MEAISSHEAVTQPRSRVMLVEDDDDMRFLMERMLRARGHAAVSFSGGRQALTSLDSYEFDTVVTDLKMPDMDGLELCARIKQSHPYLGIVLVSAFGDMSS